MVNINIYYGKLYIRDVAILKKFGDKYKLSLCKYYRQKGFEIEHLHDSFSEQINTRCKVNDEKLENNISRAKSKVFEYALCNDFDYFATLTLDKEKYDRYNLDKFKKDLSKFINNYRQKGSKIKYILIPELHSDGAWHMHGLFSGILENDLKSFDLLEKVPLKLKGKDYYSWLSYSKRFGFSSLGKIKSKEKTASYITKYISKDISKSIKELNAQLYYCSKGLNKSEVIKKGTLQSTLTYDFENKYSKVKWFDNPPVDIIIS